MAGLPILRAVPPRREGRPYKFLFGSGYAGLGFFPFFRIEYSIQYLIFGVVIIR